MTSTARACKATTKSGAACRSWCVEGSDFCFVHDPALAQERKEARSRGGRRRHGRVLDGANDALEIHDLSDVVRVLTEEVNLVRSLEVSLSRGQVVARLCQVLAGIYVDAELERRVTELEARL